VLLLMLLLCEAKLMKVAMAMSTMAAHFYWPKELHMRTAGNHMNASHNIIAIIVAAELHAAEANFARSPTATAALGLRGPLATGSHG
jgi:hypothetical protein